MIEHDLYSCDECGTEVDLSAGDHIHLVIFPGSSLYFCTECYEEMEEAQHECD